jgi:putative transposase
LPIATILLWLKQRTDSIKAECVYGPDTDGWNDVDDLELATLSWVHCFNHDRLHSHCQDVPPAEFEAAHHAAKRTTQPG